MSALVRLAYRCAYRAARAWWFVRRPHTEGAVVALWHQDRVLLVRSSYRPHHSLPGGFIKAGEPPLAAALREVAEELRLSLRPEDLTLAWRGVRPFEHRQDGITVFEWRSTAPSPPAVRVDDRELVWAGWVTRDEARNLDLLPHVREYLALG